MSSYKFAKHKNGCGHFAAIALELMNGTPNVVEWAASFGMFERIYGAAVAEGIQDALDWHVAAGGEMESFRVIDFTWLAVDTKPDAVRCAATMAAWKTLGQDECGIIFDFENEWRAKRSC